MRTIKRILIGLVVAVVVIVVAVAACQPESENEPESAETTAPEPAETEAAPEPEAETETETEPAETETEPEPVAAFEVGGTVGPWRIDVIQHEADDIMGWKTTLRLTNVSDEPVAADFLELTVIDPADGAVITTLNGAASDVPVGDTTTVEMFSSGDVTYDEAALYEFDLESSALQ